MLVLPMIAWLRARWETDRADQRGMTTETVILIAIFAGLAIAAGAIIVAKATIFIYQQPSAPRSPPSRRGSCWSSGCRANHLRAARPR
jgi:hypothetical protein